ncbi:MAG: hypothetical protein J0M16_12740, partial [Gammaproteobacteria bacterium]|nr:hypothetical protein [Gammaproteobacteria bacterium]
MVTGQPGIPPLGGIARLLARLDWRSSIVGGAAQVLLVTALAQLLALALQLFVARSLGPAEFGAYGFVLAGL